MSLDTLSTSHNIDAFTEQMHGDAGERAHLLEVADTLAAMEAQFQVAEPDEKVQLQALKESLLTELSAENPGFAVLNDVIILASVYQNRVTETILPQDGSRVKAFGTRDEYNLYLAETYVLHEKPDGGYHYLVKRQTDMGSYIFELDDQADLHITRQADRTRPSLNQHHHLTAGTTEYAEAVRELLGTTLTATGAIRKRDEQARAKADMHALFLIEDSSFADQFLHADSSSEVMKQISSLMTVKPDDISRDAMYVTIASRRNP